MINFIGQVSLILSGLFIGWAVALGVAVTITAYYQSRNRSIPVPLKWLVPKNL